MMKWGEIELTQVAIMYYKNGVSQEKIGNLLGLSKMTISRMLRKALELKIIDIQIKLPFCTNRIIGKKVEKIYQLENEQAIVVKNIGNQKLYDFLGKVGAFYLGIMDLNNKVIGSGVGNSIGAMVKYLTPIKTKNTKIIQLMGGLTEVSNSNPFTIVQELCNKLGAKGTFLTSLATIDNLKIKNLIISSSYIENIEMGNNDLAIFGIGLVGIGTLLAPGLVREEEFKELKTKGTVGDICGHCFDSMGKFINSKLEDRLVSISLKQLKKFKQRIAIVGGKNKSKAIKGALLSGIITTIIIDEDAAKEII
jgi:deoxyribonucleoside regulator